MGKTGSAVWSDDLAESFQAASERALREGAHSTQSVVPAANGTERVMWISWVPVTVAGALATAGVAMDVTELVAARADHDWVAALVDSTADAVITTRNTFTVSWNAAAEAVLGYSARQMIGRPLMTVAASLAADPDEWQTLIERVQAGETVRAREMAWLHPDGLVRTVAVTVTPITAAGPGMTGASWVVRDVSEQVRHRRELERLAYTDELTGLANRRSLNEQLAGWTVAGGHPPGAVLVVDIDDFSAVNDAIGHRGGDKVIAVVAGRLRSAVRPTDFLARIGGDEFAVGCPNVDLDTAVGIADRVCAHVAAPIGADLVPDLVGSTPLKLTVSVGIASSAPVSGHAALGNADIALYQAKSGVAGSIVVFTAALHDALRRRRQLTADLVDAAQQGQLRLVYQPVVRLGDGMLVHAEALLRWDHPALGPITPTEFIPLAESTHAIHTIGKWVLLAATRQAARWQATAGLDGVGVAVNVSAHQLTDPTLPATVTDALTRAGLPAPLLTLEVTETALVEDLDTVLPALHALRATGVGLAMDDFGTGYSSLAYLHRIPATQIKIDRSITADLTDDPAAAAIVDSLTRLATTLGLEVVAEGIETIDQSRLLTHLGVGFGQGWLFSHPLPAKELRSMRPAGGQPSRATTDHSNPSAEATPVPAGGGSAVAGGEQPHVTATYTIDRDRRITSWDEGASALTGYPPEQAIGQFCQDGLLGHTDEDGRLLCGARCPLQAVINDGQPHTARVFYRHANGHRVPAQVHGEPIRDEHGHIVGAVEVFSDDSPHRRRVEDAEASRALAHTDPVTGLPNLRRARIALAARLAHPRGQTTAAIAIQTTSPDQPTHTDDLALTEATLTSVAATLIGAVPAEDFLARTGTAQFLILTAVEDAPELDDYTNRLRRLIHTTTATHAGRRVKVRSDITGTILNPTDTLTTALARLSTPLPPPRPFTLPGESGPTV